jgi:hypothetical protein
MMPGVISRGQRREMTPGIILVALLAGIAAGKMRGRSQLQNSGAIDRRRPRDSPGEDSIAEALS